MLTIYQNKRIAKALDLCWHDYIIGFETGGLSKCSCGRKGCLVLDICTKENIPFDTRKGFFLIIENGPKMDWWDGFVMMNPQVFVMFYNMSDPTVLGGWAIKQDYIGLKLAIALNEWLEGREKCNEK